MIELCFREILQRAGRDTPGVIGRLAKDMGLSRATVSKLYNNPLCNVDLNTLRNIVAWLAANGMPIRSLGDLLRMRPSKLELAIVESGAVRICLAQYRPLDPPGASWCDVAAPDVDGMMKIIQSLSAASTLVAQPLSIEAIYAPFHYLLEHGEVKLDKKYKQSDEAEAMAITERLRKGKATSLISIGSPKANRLTELIIARLFECDPFVAPKSIKSPSEAPVPFWLAYRKGDPNVPSCCGALSGPPGGKTRQPPPGLYYLDQENAWNHCQWRKHENEAAVVEDAAVIVVRRDPMAKTVEMALFGYSGMGTQAVGELLLSRSDKLWPLRPVGGKEVGVFVCKFWSMPNELSIRRSEIIRVNDSIIERRGLCGTR